MLFRFGAGLPHGLQKGPEDTRHPWSLARMEELCPLMETP